MLTCPAANQPRVCQPADPQLSLGGLFTALQAAFADELTRLAGLATASVGVVDRTSDVGAGLAGLETAVRAAMSTLGGHLLERLLAGDTGHAGPRTGCGAGHQASFVSYRDKTIHTVLGPIGVRRAYNRCHTCRRGVVPATNSSASPAARDHPAWPR